VRRDHQPFTTTRQSHKEQGAFCVGVLLLSSRNQGWQEEIYILGKVIGALSSRGKQVLTQQLPKSLGWPVFYDGV